MEQLKILEILNDWWFLNTYQISFLLNKNKNTTISLLKSLTVKKLITIDKLTTKIFTHFQV
ncbi:hypothetical protein [Spiroplasma endosymbiont of Polydrusus pterygomalis]|uniref:hypothetical protein n=1 Tax=Spiroplasma endosymbiont of Polydrusus pterygomalis TaxID=3139327 RepID=UPI003CCADD96